MNITEATSLFTEAQAAPVAYVDLSLVTDRVPVDMSTRIVKFPAAVQRLGVQYDHLAEKVTFEATRYVDGVDLAQHTIAIHWQNGENAGIYPVTEIDLGVDGKILFNFLITANMTQNSGALVFSIHFYSILDGQFTYCLSTVPASKAIVQGLFVGDRGTVVTPDEIAVYIQRMSDLNKEIAASVEQIKAICDQKAAEVSGIAQDIKDNYGTMQQDITDLKNGAGKYPIATEDEAIAGEDNDKLMSPLRTSQLVDERLKDAVTYPIATEAEARAGIDDNKLMTPLKVAQAIEELASGGGGGGGSTIPIMSSTFTGGSFSTGEEIEIRYRWSSPNEGYGTLHVLLNNVEAITEEVQQGLNRLVIPGQVKGNYTVLMYVTDRGGLTTDRLSFVLKVGGLDISSTFDDGEDFTIKSVIKIPITIDTISLDPIYINLTVDANVTRLSGNNGYNIVQLSALTAGAHKVSIQATSGVYTSNTLAYNIVIEDADNLTIICDYSTAQVTFRDLVEIPYRVSLKGADKFSVEYLVDNESVKTLEIKTGTNIWSTRDLAVGDHTLRINVATLDGSKTAFVELPLRVNPSSYMPLQPVTDASLLCWFDATGKTNQDADRDTWEDKSGNGTVARLVDFNWGSNNGWVDNALKCNGGSYVEIDIQALKDNAPYGLTVDIKFCTRDTGDELDCVLDMRGSDSNKRGFAVDTKYMYLNSGTTKVKSAVLEDQISRATFVIDRENKLAKIYNNGVLTEAFIIQASEEFSNSTKIYLNTRLATVSGAWAPAYWGDSEIYSIRVYERALESDEIVQNLIADIPDLAEQEEKYRVNYNNMMPTMYFYGDTSAMTKDNKVPLRIRYISTDSNKYGESFDLPACSVGWQGTSSLQYAVKNYKIKLKDQSGAKYKYTPFPDGIQEDTFCLKADYMESSHANNTGMARFINDQLYDTKVPPQEANSNVRTAIDGFPIQLYIAQSNDATPEYMGVFNFNLDKGCSDSFGFGDGTLSFEVSSNSDTSAGAFKDDSDSSIRTDFELRYPDEDDCTADQINVAYAAIKRVVTWVKNSTEETFRAEVEQYFNKEHLLKYYLQVHLFGMVDNLGKNMMLTTWDGNIWYPQFYDLDTQLGLDNTGYLEFYSDIDVVAGIYNTSGSKLWTMVSTVFAAELSEMYKGMRANKYTLDNILSYWYTDQVAKIGEKQYNADMDAKYIKFKSDYLFMLHGRRYEHMRRWITERLLYLDTIYGYEADTRQSITIRANKSGSVYLNIYTYSPQYVRVVWRNGVEQRLKIGKDANGDMTYTKFSATLATSTDQEVVIYNARQIKRIDNISGLTPSVLNFVEAGKLVELSCRNDALLVDVRLSAQNKFLRNVDLYGCTALGTSSGGGNTIDFSQLYSTRSINLLKTQLENVIFPIDGSNYREIRLPGTIKRLDIENMPLLTILEVNPSQMTLFKMINNPNVKIQKDPNNSLSTILAETVEIINSISASEYITIGSETYGASSVHLDGILFGKKGRLHIKGPYSKSELSMERLEIKNCDMLELVLSKLGFKEPTILDFGGIKSRISIVLEGCANISELILPKSLRGLAVTRGKNVYPGAFDAYFKESSDIKYIYVSGEEKTEEIDLSNITISDYLKLTEIGIARKTTINVDFSERIKNGYITQDYKTFRISSLELFGNVNYRGFYPNTDSNTSYTGSVFPYTHPDKVTDEILNKLNYDITELKSLEGLFYKYLKITEIPPIGDMSKVETFRNMFGNCNVKDFPEINAISGKDFRNMYANTPYDRGGPVNINPIHSSNGTMFDGIFDINGRNVSILGIDISNRTPITNVSRNLFGGSSNNAEEITKIIFNGTIQSDFGLYDSKYLKLTDQESVQSIVSALVDYSGGASAVLQLKSVVVDVLTEEQLAIIASKNWTISQVG